ncbi:MAG TPA: discoidin domain-containing protein [Fimbriimonadaceae bacterium]|nr:discoidin domain-containing protein [Fimbriimonadaceae bacterium]
MKQVLVTCLVACAAFSQAQVNVAASVNGGVASQISDYSGGSTAEKAIDGNRDARWGIGSIQHTNFHQGAWWMVQFSQMSEIEVVNIWNRDDGLSGRINPFSVRLFDESNNVVWESVGNNFADNIDDGLSTTLGMRFNVGGVTAKSLKVELGGANWLHMAEVEAYTVVPEPSALAAFGLGAIMLIRKRAKRS